MGNTSSQLDSRLSELEKSLQHLKSLDQNQDGYISKSEYLSFVENIKEEIVRSKDLEYQGKIQKLEEEVALLKSVNHDLEVRLEKKPILISDSTVHSKTGEVLGELSRQYLDKEIDKILANKDVNMSLIPDKLERKLYHNIFGMFFGLMDELSKSTSFNFMGHSLNFQIQALPRQYVSSSDKEKDD